MRFSDQLDIVRFVCEGAHAVCEGGIHGGCLDIRSDDGSFGGSVLPRAYAAAASPGFRRAPETIAPSVSRMWCYLRELR